MGVIGYQKTQRGNSWCHVQCTRFHQHVWMTCFEDNAVGGSGVSEVHSIWTGTKHHVLITSGTHVNKAIKPMHSTLHMSTPDDCCIRIEWWSTTNCLEINECRQWQCWHESHLLTKKNSLWPLAVLGSLSSSPPSTTSSPSTNGFLKINLLTTTHSFQESTWFHASKFPGRVSSHIILSHIIGWNSQVSRKANCQTSATPIINARDPHHSFNLLTMGLLIINAESLMNLDLLGIRLLNQSALQHHV